MNNYKMTITLDSYEGSKIYIVDQDNDVIEKHEGLKAKAAYDLMGKLKTKYNIKNAIFA
jgi:hypothetical protein